MNKVRELLDYATKQHTNILLTSLVCVPYSLQPDLISIRKKMEQIRYDGGTLA